MAEFLGALSVVEFISSSALNLMAFAVEDAESSRAGFDDALLTNKLGASWAFRDDTGALSGPLVSRLAVLVAGSFEESESFWAAGSDALALDEGESALDVAAGGNTFAFLNLPASRALEGNTVAVFQGVADGASGLLAFGSDQDESWIAGIDLLSSLDDGAGR